MKNNYFSERLCCPVCGSKKTIELINLPYTDPNLEKYLLNFYTSQGKIELDFLRDTHFEVVECESCSFIFQKYIPDDLLMRKLYEEWIDPEFAKKASLKRPLYYTERLVYEILDAIKYLNKEPHELKFMDFGMGWGEWCKIALALGVDTYGMELSQERIKNANYLHIKNIEWDELPNYEFDYINTEQVIEHVPEPVETIKHLMTSLKPGGLLKISVPNAKNVKSILKSIDWNAAIDSDRSLKVISPLEHINGFTRKSILKLAQECGLELAPEVRKLLFREKVSTSDFLKLKLGPLYRKIKKPKIEDTSIFFIKI